MDRDHRVLGNDVIWLHCLRITEIRYSTGIALQTLSFWTSRYRAYLLSLTWASQLLRDVAANAGFLCDKDEVQGPEKKGSLCHLLLLYFHFYFYFKLVLFCITGRFILISIRYYPDTFQFNPGYSLHWLSSMRTEWHNSSSIIRSLYTATSFGRIMLP